jgi:hypothetical protein
MSDLTSSEVTRALLLGGIERDGRRERPTTEAVLLWLFGFDVQDVERILKFVRDFRPPSMVRR